MLAFDSNLAGFAHSAYTFGCESHVIDSALAGVSMPPGALLMLLQRGVLYTEAELCAPQDDSPERTLIEPLTLVEAVMPDATTQQGWMRLKHKFQINNQSPTMTTNNSGVASTPSTTANNAAPSSTSAHDENTPSTSAGAIGQHHQHHQLSTTSVANHLPPNYKVTNGQPNSAIQANNSVGGPPHSKYPKMNAAHQNGPVPLQQPHLSTIVNSVGSQHQQPIQSTPGGVYSMEVDGELATSRSGLREIQKDRVMYLKGHESEVFICAWNPKNDYLASG